LFARTADRNSYSRRANRIILKKRVLQMNLRGVKHAVTCVKTVAEEEVNARCLTLCAHPAEPNVRFLSNPEMIVPFIAATVFLNKGSYSNRNGGAGGRLTN
jgi:hypothetical protein